MFCYSSPEILQHFVINVNIEKCAEKNLKLRNHRGIIWVQHRGYLYAYILHESEVHQMFTDTEKELNTVTDNLTKFAQALIDFIAKICGLFGFDPFADAE